MFVGLGGDLQVQMAFAGVVTAMHLCMMVVSVGIFFPSCFCVLSEVLSGGQVILP